MHTRMWCVFLHRSLKWNGIKVFFNPTTLLWQLMIACWPPVHCARAGCWHPFSQTGSVTNFFPRRSSTSPLSIEPFQPLPLLIFFFIKSKRKHVGGRKVRRTFKPHTFALATRSRTVSLTGAGAASQEYGLIHLVHAESRLRGSRQIFLHSAWPDAKGEQEPDIFTSVRDGESGARLRARMTSHGWPPRWWLHVRAVRRQEDALFGWWFSV